MTSTVSSVTTPFVAPGILDAPGIVPALMLAFIAFNVSSDPKYASLRGHLASMLQNPLSILPEIVGFISVVAVVAAGLLLLPDGIRASKQTLASLKETDDYMFQMRQFWPVLLHPDSLIVCQELMLGLGAALLLVRGACSSGRRFLGLALGLLSIGRGIHVDQWTMAGDYAPEGPLGGAFAAGCAGAAGLILLVATIKSLRMNNASCTGIVRDLMTIVGFVGLCVCVAKDNHITASDTYVRNVLFSAIDMVDLCALPFLASSACGLALKTADLGGAWACFLLSQVFASWWLLDFTGFLDDPLSANAFIAHSLKIKQHLMAQVYGCPFALFAIGQIVRGVSALVAYGGYAMLRFSASDIPRSNQLLTV